MNARGTLPWLHATTWPGTGQAGDVSTRRYKIKAAYLRRSFTEDQLATIYPYLSAPAGPSGGGMTWIRDFYRDVYRDTGGVPVPNDVSDGSYINYPDNDLADPAWNTSRVPWSTLYYKGNYRRLQQVKARWDPGNVFQHTLGVEPRA